MCDVNGKNLPIPCAPPEEMMVYEDTSLLPTCSICMDVIRENDSMRLLCTHQFHASCMMENVMKSNNTCPNCREVLTKKPPGLPNINDDLIVMLTKETLDETFPSVAESFLENNIFDSMTKREKKLIKIKLCYALSVFGYDISKKIKKWIESRHDSESEHETTDIINEDMQNFITEFQLHQYADRIYNNDYLSNMEQFLSATVETFISPPGHNMTHGPYFTRQEAENLMNTIILYYSQRLDEHPFESS